MNRVIEFLRKCTADATEEEKEDSKKILSEVVTEDVLKARASSDLEGLIGCLERMMDDINKGDFKAWMSFLDSTHVDIISFTKARFMGNFIAFKDGTSLKKVLDEAAEESHKN